MQPLHRLMNGRNHRRHRRTRRAVGWPPAQRLLVWVAALNRRSPPALSLNNATSLQVCVAVMAGMVWCIEHPGAGIVEPDEIEFRRILDICLPYLGPVVGAYLDWTPLADRGWLFPEELDRRDPWQFIDIRRRLMVLQRLKGPLKADVDQHRRAVCKPLGD